MPDHHGFTRKRFQPRDIALLWSKAGGFCSHPECPLHLLAEEQATDPAQTLGEMAHIVGHSPDGPRGDACFPREQIDLYENLILLCAHHHTLVDKQWQSYPVDLLVRWKNEHEAEIWKRLSAALPNVRFDELDEVARSIAIHPNPPTATFTAIPLLEKMRRNDLTPHVRLRLNQAIAGVGEVTAYVQNKALYDEQFPERLRDGFRRRYDADRQAGLSGDALFLSLAEFAGGDASDSLRYAAGLSVLGYFFNICEVFES